MGNSFYVQISPYLLLEYIYADNSTTYLSSQVKLSRIKNDYLGGQLQFVNGSAAQNITQNVVDFSAANLGGYKWALLNRDVPVPYISTDNNLTLTDLSGLLSSVYVKYDTVRVHIISGYRLEDLQGLIFQAYAKEAMTSNITVLANNVYLNSDSRDILNPRPIMLGDRMYDRYIEFLIPAVKGINEDFYSNPSNPISIGYQYTTTNGGILFNSGIYFKVFEIKTTEKKGGNLFLYTSNVYETSVNQEDIYSALAANIQESTNGDYFTYYPTYGGNFVADFIESLNANGGDYVVINDIEVYEQVGLDNILTFSFSQMQGDGFDSALEFRPIIKYADSAVTFSIDYSVRVYNRANGFQIIRRASTTSFNPRKYGKQLEKIALATQSYPFKVYNKVYGNSPVTFVGNDYATQFSTVYVPVFYESRNLTVQHKTVLANGTNPISPDFYDNINFGQGDARIYLSDYESYFKFAIRQVQPTTGALTPLDLTSGDVVMVFKDAQNNDIRIPAEASDSHNSKSQGEVVFKLPDYIRKKVLTTKSVQPFYIVSSVSGASDTLIYSGTVDKIENISKETARVKDIVSLATTSATGASASGASSPTIKVKTNGAIAPGKSIVDTLTDSNSLSIDTIKSTPAVNPVSIPGYSVDSNGSSIKNGVSPISMDAEVVAKSDVSQRLSQSSGTKTTLN